MPHPPSVELRVSGLVDIFTSHPRGLWHTAKSSCLWFISSSKSTNWLTENLHRRSFTWLNQCEIRPQAASLSFTGMDRTWYCNGKHIPTVVLLCAGRSFGSTDLFQSVSVPQGQGRERLLNSMGHSLRDRWQLHTHWQKVFCVEISLKKLACERNICTWIRGYVIETYLWVAHWFLLFV